MPAPDGPFLPAHLQRCQGREYVVDGRFSIVCSASWQFNGVYAGKDLWNQWSSVNGMIGPEKSGVLPELFVRPFLDEPIIVVGYELIKKCGPTDLWLMVGGGIQPDAQIWLGPGETRSEKMFAAGLGQPWPARHDKLSLERNDMINLHGGCSGLHNRAAQ